MKKISILLAGLAFTVGFGQLTQTVNVAPNFAPDVAPNAVILDQTTLSTNGIVSGAQADGKFAASADDFDLTWDATKLTKFSAFGFCNSGDLIANSTGAIFYIIADDDWMPAGSNPETDNLYVFNKNHGDAGFTVIQNETSFTYELDLSAEDVVLPAGKYWLSVVPKTTLSDIASMGTNRWNWYRNPSNNGMEGHLTDPYDLFGVADAGWLGLSSLGLEWESYDLGMLIEGEETTMGVNDLTSTSISVYPNPATNFVKATGDVKEMTVINMNGKVVATSKTASVNVSALPSGVYIVKVVDVKGNVTTSKVVKK